MAPEETTEPTPTTEEVNEALMDQDAMDERAAASVEAYKEAIGDGDPTGAEPVTDPDGNEVSPQDMPSTGVWAGQDPEQREEGAPNQEANDEEEAEQGTPQTQLSQEDEGEGNGGTTTTPTYS